MFIFGLSFRLFLFFVFFNVLFISNNVSAHARWATVADSANTLVTPRTNATGLKEPAPCGGAVRTLTPKVLKKGTTVIVQFRETILHDGYFTISFSAAGDTGFAQNILLDNIHTNGQFR